MRIRFQNEQLRNACGIALIAATLFSTIVFIPDTNITIWKNFHLQDMTIFAAQIILLILVFRLPAEVSPKIKAFLAILIFIAIRTVPNLIAFNKDLITTNIGWFMIFTIMYATGIYLTLDALEEMIK